MYNGEGGGVVFGILILLCDIVLRVVCFLVVGG